ncbi:HAMP domain-containing sensor histidine kinase [Maridesulfovibrio sp.]|uniref:sensor histidine kinase n=1 Tax=Maridesulfovibrio sp. TaxID=2795000 RepID=UPI002A18742C|nr:HAMP domain-containing sensor histidine kinase [Maridesulfovibrio sp.]
MSKTAEYLAQDLDTCPEHVMKQNEMLRDRFAAGLIDSVPHISFIVNSEREVVLYNRSLAERAIDNIPGGILGKRPGEIFHCGNARNNRCGESDPCINCGAFLAIHDALSGQVGTEECMLLADLSGMVSSYIFQVTAAPLKIGDELFAIVYMTDISDSKNKEVVEKIFLHDLMNAVNGIVSAGSLLKEDAIKDSSRQLAAMVVDRALFMANEINAHRLFVSAEAHQLEICNERFPVREIVDSVCTFFSGSQLVADSEISIEWHADESEITTDKRILYRILENLVKNALEASPQGGTVTVNAVRNNGGVLFSVNNEGAIPITVAHQIFKRSFSTKGKGRGLGTYSVKMFTENYLQGRTWFDSSVTEGTNFYVQLPAVPAGGGN